MFMYQCLVSDNFLECVHAIHMETALGKRISMNDVDIQEGTACRSVDVVVGYSSCAKYLKDTAASLSVPSFGMSIIFTF
jgi:hypothetical protein